jgi:hypothetical protein
MPGSLKEKVTGLLACTAPDAMAEGRELVVGAGVVMDRTTTVTSRT